MISINLKVDQVRLLRNAKTEAELRGVVDLVLEKIEQAEVLRDFKRASEAAPKSEGPSGPRITPWKRAKDVMGQILGDDLKVPPFPDRGWFMRVNRYIKLYGLDDEKLTKLAEFAKENMRPPYSLDFLVSQHERILAGNYNRNARRGAASTTPYYVPNWKQADLPQLPEE